MDQARGPDYQLKYEKEARARQAIGGTLKTDVLIMDGELNRLRIEFDAKIGNNLSAGE